VIDMRRTTTMILGLALAFATVTVDAQRNTQAEVRLQAAITKETVEGDLAGAIALYKQLAGGADRSVAARALVRMGACYERLGDKDARAAYERAAKEFGDQAEPAAQARARLAAMGGAKTASGPRTRLLWDEATNDLASASADGRYLSFMDRETGDVALKDVVTGEERRVTNKGGVVKAQGTAEGTAMSPDGRRIAFVWDTWDEDSVKTRQFFHLRVINADGTGERVLRRAADLNAHAWSPDGRWIAGWVADGTDPASANRLAVWSADTGEERVLATKGLDVKRRVRFSPDGQWLAYDEAAGQGQPSAVYVLRAEGSTAAEVEIASDARMMGWAPDGRSILFARDREGVTLLFRIPVAQGKATGSAQQIHNASSVGEPVGLTTDGRLLYGVDNRRDDGWLGSIDLGTANLGATTAQFPADKAHALMNSGGLRLSPDGRQVMWLVLPNRIIMRSTAGERLASVTAPLKEVRRAEWSHDSAAILAAGTGSDGKEGVYRIDPANGTATLLTSSLDGTGRAAFVPSRDGRTLYGRTPAGTLAALSLDNGAVRVLHEEFLRLPNLSLSHDGRMLAVRSGPQLGVVDLASGAYTRLYTRVFETDRNVMFGLAWSADDSRVVVIARDPGTAICELWIYPAAGGPRVSQRLPVEMRGLSIGPDGTAAAIRVEQRRQIWSLENFLPATK
jgi:Tol biopolymer transport system component